MNTLAIPFFIISTYMTDMPNDQTLLSAQMACEHESRVAYVVNPCPATSPCTIYMKASKHPVAIQAAVEEIMSTGYALCGMYS